MVYPIAGNYYNSVVDIASAPRSADMQSRAGLEEMALKLERNTLILQTLLMVLLEKKVIQEPEFREWLAYVDGLDGVRDGRLREDKRPLLCPQCGRNSPRAIPKCMYCGQDLDADFLQHRPEAPGGQK